jgi:hypothetical protein
VVGQWRDGLRNCEDLPKNTYDLAALFDALLKASKYLSMMYEERKKKNPDFNLIFSIDFDLDKNRLKRGQKDPSGGGEYDGVCGGGGKHKITIDPRQICQEGKADLVHVFLHELGHAFTCEPSMFPNEEQLRANQFADSVESEINPPRAKSPFDPSPFIRRYPSAATMFQNVLNMMLQTLNGTLRILGLVMIIARFLSRLTRRA